MITEDTQVLWKWKRCIVCKQHFISLSNHLLDPVVRNSYMQIYRTLAYGVCISTKLALDRCIPTQTPRHPEFCKLGLISSSFNLLFLLNYLECFLFYDMHFLLSLQCAFYTQSGFYTYNPGQKCWDTCTFSLKIAPLRFPPLLPPLNVVSVGWKCTFPEQHWPGGRGDVTSRKRDPPERRKQSD